MSNLQDVSVGTCARIVHVKGTGALRLYLLNMGMLPNTIVKVNSFAPMGDPMELSVQNYVLTLRKEEAEKIEVDILSESDNPESEQNMEMPPKIANQTEHPGLGEEGRYHIETAVPLPDGEKLSFALVGNQNCGKTTLFNQLTGANQHVGNFPGVTVSRKDGALRHHSNTVITDLPGIYSMSPYTSEEIVTRDFVLTEHPKCIINIVDATNLVRNLNLTVQLMELDVPMVLAINMMDELTNNGGTIRVNLMEELLGIPVVPISAAKGEGIDELINHAIHVAKYQEKPRRHDFCDAHKHNGAVHRAIHSIIHLIEDHAEWQKIPVRFVSSKIIEGDSILLNSLQLDSNEKEMLEHIITQMEKERGMDRAAAIIDMRYEFIRSLCMHTITQPKESKERIRSRKIDKVLAGKYTSIPVFFLIMQAVFYLTFEVLGPFFQNLLDALISQSSNYLALRMTEWKINEVLQSFVTDGLFTGVGSVISFLPFIVFLFFFLSMLEDSGYIARVAYVMDKLLRKIGLSGRSIVPMLIGFGCTVPAVMATRTLPSARDRKLTILLTPFMSCTAKLPIYAFLVSVFFNENRGLIITGLYLLGILCSILMALLLKRTILKGEAVPFVMELPNYRWPGFKNVSQLLWEKTADFLQRAFTLIFAATVVIWFLQKFNIHFQTVSDESASMLANLAGMISPIFRPLGLDDWRICVSLISGFMAKESVVSTLNILTDQNAGDILCQASAVSLLVFCLLYTPCIAAVAAIRRELGRRWAVVLVIWQCVLAWIAAYIIHAVYLIFTSSRTFIS